MPASGCRGYTLIEVLLALALVSIIITLITTLSGVMARVYEDQAARSELQYTARMCLQVMREDIKEASRVEIMENGHRIKLTGNGGEILYYYVQQEQLYQHGKSKVPVAENIGRVYFYRLSPGCTGIDIEGRLPGQHYLLSTAVFSWPDEARR